MKIAAVAIDILEVPVEDAYLAGGRAVESNWHILARITTDDGAEGFGYMVNTRAQLIPSIASAARELGDLLVGLNVLETEAAWQAMTRAAKWVGPGGLLHWAIAPLDIALWDAAGKTLGQPLYRMLGGFRDRIPAYASDRMWYSLSLDDLAASAADHADAGYTAIKLRLGREATPAEQAERARVAGEAAGPGVTVMVDGTESWDLPYAHLAGRALQDAGAKWLEDPVHHADIAGLASLKRALDIPVTGGENLYTLAQFRQTLEAQALDIAILDLFRVGGITPWPKIAALAEAHRIMVCGHVVPEVHAHLLAAVSNGHMVEYMPRSNAILVDPPVPVEGMFVLPQTPGHGLVLDRAAVERFRAS